MRILCLLCLLRASAARAAELPATAAKDTMAVMDFNAANASASDAATLSGFIRGAVVRSDKYLVVEKKNMDKILAEQAFQQTGCTSSECAVKLGKILNARKMIVGEYTVLDGTRFLTASLVDVETGQIERTAKVKDFDLRSADEAADRLVANLTGVALASDTASGFHAREPEKPRRPRAVRTRFALAGGTRIYAVDSRVDFTGSSMNGVAHTGPYAGASRTVREQAFGTDLTLEYWRTFSETGSWGFGVLAGLFGPGTYGYQVSVRGTPTTGNAVTFDSERAGTEPGAQGEVDLFWNLKPWLNVLVGADLSTHTYKAGWGSFDDGTTAGRGFFGSGPFRAKSVLIPAGKIGVEGFLFEHLSVRGTVAFAPTTTVHFDPATDFGRGFVYDTTIHGLPVFALKASLNY